MDKHDIANPNEAADRQAWGKALPSHAPPQSRHSRRHITARSFAISLCGERDSAPTFEEIPPSLSGIAWTHTAGKSASKHLPETSGAGCAFLDYDNDGWMDIYLVNSGKADFYDPPRPLRNALYHNNRDGTFTDITERAGVAGYLCHSVRQQHPVSQQWRRHLH